MPAKLTFHLRHQPSRVVILREGPAAVVGRDPSSQILLDDPQVSKTHARFSWAGGRLVLDDLASKNGTLVNGMAAAATTIADGDWISFAGVLARCDLITDAEAAALEAGWRARRQSSIELQARLSGELSPTALLERLIESAIDLTGAERGFVLAPTADGALRPVVVAGFDRESFDKSSFHGSIGAVDRVLRSRIPIVLSDVGADWALARRPSVVDQGIATLACVPLISGEELLGVLYVDGTRANSGFADLDVEILAGLADQAALVLASARVDTTLRDLLYSSYVRVAEEHHELLGELERVLSAARTGSPTDAEF